MHSLLQDVRFSLRLMRKRPAMTLVVITALVLGLGAHTAVFTVVNAVILRPLPLYEPDRIVKVYAKINNASLGISYPEYLEWKAQATSFDAIAVYRLAAFNLTGDSSPEHVKAFAVVPSCFQVLGITTALGRPFIEGDDRAAADRVVILNHRFWKRKFGGDKAILGRSLTLDDRAYTVVGVLEDSPVAIVQQADVWVPNAPFLDAVTMRRTSRYYWPAARLKSNVTEAQATTELETMAARLAVTYPASNRNAGVRVVSLIDMYTADGRKPVLFLLLASSLIFLLACINVLIMSLSNTLERGGELSIRLALGSSRAKLLRQFLVQAVLFAGIGSVLALAGAQLGLNAMVRLFPTAIGRFQETSTDWRVILFLTAMALLVSVVACVVPAFYWTRIHLARSLNDNLTWLRSSTSRILGHNGLIVAEVAFACALSVVASLLIKSFYEVSKVDLGFTPHGIVSFHVNLPESRYKQDEQVLAFHKRVLDNLSIIPGVRNINGLSNLPLTPTGNILGLEVENDPPDVTAHPKVEYECVFPGLFRTMKMPVLQGRDFTDADRIDSPRVVIVDEKLAAAYWPGVSPLGKRLRLTEGNDPNPPWREVVGVVPQIKHFGPESKPRWMQVYLAQYQDPTSEVSYVMDTKLPLATVKASVDRAIHQLDKDLPLDNFQTMDDLLGNYTASRKVSFLLLTGFAAIGLILSTIGIYAVVANSVARRRREIAIRVALGATRQHTALLVARPAAISTLAGLALGLGMVAALARVLKAFLFGVTPLAPAAYFFSVAGILVFALLACLVPTTAIFRLDPQETLRE
jgi:predicted permease